MTCLYFFNIIGLTVDQFHAFHSELKAKLESTSLFGGEKATSGRPRALNSEAQLLLFLLWMRQYLNERILAWIFGIPCSLINDYLQTTLNICYDHFKDKIQFPDRGVCDQKSRFIGTIQITIVIDGSEQQVEVAHTRLYEQATWVRV